MLVVVHLFACESESFLDHIGEDGKVEWLRVIEGFDCACGDPRNDLPHCQRKQQAENWRDDLAHIRAIVSGLQRHALPEEALQGR